MKQDLTTVMPWTVLICGLGFRLPYFTYPKDAEKVRKQMAERRQELIQAHEAAE